MSQHVVTGDDREWLNRAWGEILTGVLIEKVWAMAEADATRVMRSLPSIVVEMVVKERRWVEKGKRKIGGNYRARDETWLAQGAML